jgi:two-component system, cell cycle response regulator
MPEKVHKRVLLIEDNPPDAVIIQEYLLRGPRRDFDLLKAHDLHEGLDRLEREKIDIVLLDLTLPDCDGYETFARTHQHSPRVPIVILTGLDDGKLAEKILSKGAQDYLVKGQFDRELLKKCILYAIDRAKVEADLLIANQEIESLVEHLQNALQEVTEMANKDPLTGLANSRHFYELAEVEMRLFRRYDRPRLALAYIDLDDFKHVNDTLGHSVGDELLQTVAEVMSDTLREVDIVGRMGGDEFAILLPDCDEDGCRAALSRLQTGHARTVDEKGWPSTMSIGCARYSYVPVSVDRMISDADTLMYQAKASGKDRLNLKTFEGQRAADEAGNGARPNVR